MKGTTKTGWALIAPLALVAVSCTSSAESAAGETDVGDEPSDPVLVAMPPVDNVETAVDQVGAAADLRPVALINDDGQLVIVGDDGVVGNDWFKFTAFPSPDRSAAVLSLGPHIRDIGPMRPVVWVDLPTGERLAEHAMRSTSELTATSIDGTFAGFTTRAAEPADDAIAGARLTSEIEIISREAGTVFEQTLDGNFVPEAFSRRTTVSGIPSLVFLLEYFPAEAPRYYRVRVLSTDTGEVSLPLNLRNKSEQIDERMAGVSRSQVVAEEHGLLFTLYRGTIDGDPDGEPYAFVHTLDLADGVWCLDIDPLLELDELAGSLAVGGERLYVASQNGRVGSYPIPALEDPNLSPNMDWVVDTGVQTEGAPVMTADDESAYVADPTRPGFLHRVTSRGEIVSPVRLPGEPQAMAWHKGGLHAIGTDWATFRIGTRPSWLGQIAAIIID